MWLSVSIHRSEMDVHNDDGWSFVSIVRRPIEDGKTRRHDRFIIDQHLTSGRISWHPSPNRSIEESPS